MNVPTAKAILVHWTALVGIVLGCGTAWADIQLGKQIADGFVITEFAGSNLANDIYCLTFDPRGRVVVAGRGYIRILVDDDDDGKADRSILFADHPKDGAMGLLWEGDTLWCTGDGGLRKFHDRNGDGRADGPAQLVCRLKTGGEHTAHAIRRGPDRRLYVLCGNMTGIDASFAQTPTSPIRRPVAGCVIRFSTDMRHTEIVADGFRNAYDMDFNAAGDLFAYDSDNERCVSLPWYEGTRLYHVLPGGHHGWLSPQRAEFFRLPPYFCDVVPPLLDLGRGSPTGVVCYRHHGFPPKYRGGLFLLDWTFGRVYFIRLTPDGSTYRAEKEIFLQAVGDDGFAPTDVAVHPVTGDLYVSIGGRGTKGAVYRIRYVGPRDKHDRGHQETTSETDLWRYRKRLQRALDQGQATAVEPGHHADRIVRLLEARLIERDLLRGVEPRRSSPFGTLLTKQLAQCTKNPDGVIEAVAPLVADRQIEVAERLTAVRILQLALGDLVSSDARGTIWEGYTLHIAGTTSRRRRVLSAVRRAFPSGHCDLDRELSRTLALVEDDAPESLRLVIERLTEDSSPIEDVHYLTVAARLRAIPTEQDRRRIAAALLALDRKLRDRRLRRDRNWPLRIKELYRRLAEKVPNLHSAMVTAAEFGRPDHALFASCPGFDRRRAAEVFLKRSEEHPEFAWTPPVIDVVAVLPPERTFPLFRRLYDNPGLRDAAVRALARSPQEADRHRFFAALESPQLGTVRMCLEALARLSPPKSGNEYWAVIRLLRSLGNERGLDKLRRQAAAYLVRATGEKQNGTDGEAWTKWFIRRFPELARKQEAGGRPSQRRKLARVVWSAGDAERGKNVFIKAGCAACHSGARALGPDLQGVTLRFSRDDLLTAILEPGRDVSPRYQSTLITTKAGKLYLGVVIYEAADGVILQTGVTETVRIASSDIIASRRSPVSLMPTGLLDPLSPEEIADLFAYLRTLGRRNGR